LVIRNEENFAEKTTLTFNYAKLLVLTTALLIVLFSVSFYLSSTILAKWFHPASKELELNKQLLELSAAVDSLSEQLAYREKFLFSVHKAVEGDKRYLNTDSSTTDQSTAKPSKNVDVDYIAPVEMELRNEFENSDKAQIKTVSNSGGTGFANLFLFSPINGGIITEKFNGKKEHYGLDLVAKKDEPVKAVTDGTVIFSSWTNDTGHVIAIQHANNLISVYKHNSVLLKKLGNFVKAGEIIAVIGNSGELTTGPHLHFELWHNSNPVDPEQFVSF
jgi:murein DD-endopeptidase MepM/ murein hydrolase activator NlpD